MADPLAGDRNVAVACQGGGSHTAFTAGVLAELFAEWPEEARLVGISGSSGGAVCALAAWYGLLADDHTPGGRLEAVWGEIAAADPADAAINEWVRWATAVENAGGPVPEVSPYYTPASAMGKRRLRAALEGAVDFDRVPDLAGGDAPLLAVGTVDVERGEFEVFEDGAVTPEAVLASAAVPHLYEAVAVDGRHHWDGLFSQNPPVHELMTVDVERKPAELWVVQVNPQEREGVPTSLLGITDRRNELAGNLSLNQELRFVRRVNEWIAEGDLSGEYVHTEVERIALDADLGYASKLDRGPDFLDDLRERGRGAAAEFLDDRERDRA
jgi:NTE family protein